MPCFLLLSLLGVEVGRGDQIVVSNKNDAGAGSLRQAIEDANSRPGLDTIVFNIGGAMPANILLASELPSLTESVIIDATTQPGYAGEPLIGLVGSGAAGGANGLALQGGSSEVRGLVINRFRGSGIRITSDSNVVAGCYLGTSLAGNARQGNSIAGVEIVQGRWNRIGGTNAADRNLISANQTGVYIVGFRASNNVVCGNFIGSDVNGSADLGNTNNGVLISAPANTVGGSQEFQRNLISGNGQSGVYLYEANAWGNWVAGNYIGTRVNGTVALSNSADGLTIFNARDNLVGGQNAGEGNLISGNHGRGVLIFGANARSNLVSGNWIGLDATGRGDLGNRSSGVGISGCSSNLIGGLGAGSRNLISGNNQSGVAADSNGVANVICGNWIGLDVSGTNAVPNSLSGISILGGSGFLIGGDSVGAGNVISGNTLNGILLGGTSSGIKVTGNWIGCDSGGLAARGNGQAGVRVESARHLIGGLTPGERNVISGNGGSGILIFNLGAALNVVRGNYIGTDVTGTNRLGNGLAGIGLTNAALNCLGTPEWGGGNVISANSNSGIYLYGTGAISNRIQGNWIGTDFTGTRALGNGLGGVFLYRSGTNLIGGTEPGARNLISGNQNVAVSIGDPGANGNVLLGNFIGTKSDGLSPLPNQWHGIEFSGTASANRVGGTAPGEANLIAFAQTTLYDGIRIRDGCTNNTVRGNAIFGNGGLALDLGAADGLNANDPGDGDWGANGLQNYPVLTTAFGRHITAVSGRLNSRPNRSFTLDFYGNAVSDPGGAGEGYRHLGSAVVYTDETGESAFSVLLTNAVSAGNFITATATDAYGNTSEFASNLALGSSPDTDGDGMPDDFELAFGLNSQHPGDATEDVDGDGASNLAEFNTGTRPDQSGSVLRAEVVLEEEGVSLCFPTVLGKTYRVEDAVGIVDGWELLFPTIPGNGGRVSVTDKEITRQKFYRVVQN